MNFFFSIFLTWRLEFAAKKKIIPKTEISWKVRYSLLLVQKYYQLENIALYRC